MNIRMLTETKTGTIGATFTKHSDGSAFGKVFHNNMDMNSFASDMEEKTIEKQIELTFSNSKTAIFHFNGEISEKLQYRNCQVSKK